jgi:RNA polymerase sigma-70 factor (ECF subfamily)
MREQSVHTLPASEVIPRGDRLATLFDCHYARLYRLARRLVPTIDDALDLVQETFVRAARASRRVPTGQAAEEAWLVRILINIRRDDWRKASVRSRTPLETSAQAQSPEAAWVARTTVWQALDRLPPRRRAIVVMHSLEDMDVREIASLLGINSVTVRWHLSVGRRELSRVLKSYLGGDQ